MITSATVGLAKARPNQENSAVQLTSVVLAHPSPMNSPSTNYT